MSTRYLRCLCTWPRLYTDKTDVEMILLFFQDIHAYVIAHEELDCHAYVEFKLGSCPRSQLRTLTNMWLGTNAFDFRRVTHRFDKVLAYVTKTDISPIVKNISPKHFSTRFHLFKMMRMTGPTNRMYYSYYCNNSTLRELIRELDKSKSKHTYITYSSWLTQNRMYALAEAGPVIGTEDIADAAWETEGKQWLEALLMHQCTQQDPGQQRF